MPYSAASTATMPASTVQLEEKQVEKLLGGQTPVQRQSGVHWSLGSSSKSVIGLSNTIYVQPPTPERVTSPQPVAGPSSLSRPASDSALPDLAIASSSKSPATRSPPTISTTTLAYTSSQTALPISMQVLPEVRSPPRVDSLQLTTRRGRRPRLFGFTEMPDHTSSGSSGPNSPDESYRGGSRSPQSRSPLSGSPNHSPPTTPAIGPASHVSGNIIPRRMHPSRARSESSLPMLKTAVTSAAPAKEPAAAPAGSKRRIDNGLKLNLEGIVAPLSGPHSASILSPYSAKLIRKKSGEILRPALKYVGPLDPASGTPLATPAKPSPTRYESKSCPTTPSCPKYVHFDSQLERVKLFLHDQKPQVVSRDGSPTEHYTTSEGEAEEFPFPSTDEEGPAQKQLQIRLPNFPTSHAHDADIFLESLFLDEDRKSIKGLVQVRNLHFQKWVAIRYTLDWWHTTSEVTATHKDSIKGGTWDRFGFQIKLHDVLSKIEEKTLFIALRYNTDGREIWDSNGGSNYQVTFKKMAPPPVRSTPVRPSAGQNTMQAGMGRSIGGRTSQWSLTGGGSQQDRLADLRMKLNNLSVDDADRDLHLTSPRKDKFAPLSPSKRYTGSLSPQSSPRGTNDPLPEVGPAAPGSVIGLPLANRYDFGSALKDTGRRSSPSGGKRTELPEVQTGLLSYSPRNRHAATEFYSPRNMNNELPQQSVESVFASTESQPIGERANMPLPLPIPDLNVQGPSPPANNKTSADQSYFASRSPPSPLRPVATLKRAQTSPAAPSTSLPVWSSPRASRSDDDSSPPLLDSSSVTTGSATSASPRSPMDAPFSSLPQFSPQSGKQHVRKDSDEMSNSSYSSFIDQFCWAGAPTNKPSLETRRNHSTGSLDHYFSSFADNSASGRTTPTASTPRFNYPHHSYTSYSSTISTPSKADMEHVDALTEQAVRSIGSSCSTTPIEGSPVTSPMMGPVMAM